MKEENDPEKESKNQEKEESQRNSSPSSLLLSLSFEKVSHRLHSTLHPLFQ